MTPSFPSSPRHLRLPEADERLAVLHDGGDLPAQRGRRQRHDGERLPLGALHLQCEYRFLLVTPVLYHLRQGIVYSVV